MSQSWVLTNVAVRESIARIRARRVHPFFPAYLHLRQRAAEQGRLTDLHPDWSALGAFLQVRDAPASHPYFRPFTLGPGPNDSEWLNRNLPGSYARSSLRPGQPALEVVEAGSRRGLLSLRPDHWVRALEHLLFGEKMPLAPLAGFLLRDFAIETDVGGPPGYPDLDAAFIETFGYNDRHGHVELEYLYGRGVERYIDFEPFTDRST